MHSVIKVLIVEDLPSDAELAERELQTALGPCGFFRVETRAAYLAALEEFQPDLIVSDFMLPAFDGLSALKLAKELAPDLPFIMLTGSMNEDTAVECMKAGAWDYVIKEHVKRLGAAARGALDLRQTRRERQHAELLLRQSEQRLKVAQRLGRIGHWEFDVQTQQIQWSDAVFVIYGREPKLGPPNAEEEASYYSPEVARELRACAKRTIETGEAFELCTSLALPDGRSVDITIMGSALTDLQGRVVRLLGTVQDVTERTRSEAQIRHLNSVLWAIRNINKLIVRERDPARLIQQACDMLVENRGFKGAWIGLVGNDAAIGSSVQAGFGSGFEPFASWLGAGNLPACLAEAESCGNGVLVFNPQVQCTSCRLSREYAGGQAVVVRICHETTNYGILGVSFPDQLAVDEEERTLLAEVAADLAFALCDIQLEGQRDRYAQIVASSQEAMALIDPLYTYLEVNAAYGRLVGVPPAALVGQSVASIVGNEQFLECMKPSLAQCFGGHVVQVANNHATSCGPKRYCDAIFSPCFSSDASVFAAALCIRDVTQQKQAELDLQVERDNLNAFLAAAPAAILVLDSDHRVVHANSAAAQLVGKPIAELSGGRCGDLLGCAHRLDGSRGCGSGLSCASCPLFAVVHQTLELGQAMYEREVAIELESNGATERRWFVANAAPLTVQNAPGVVLAMHDVTERRKAAETLRFQAMLLAAQNEASIDGIIIEDDHGKLLWCNRRFAELWALPFEAVQPGTDGAAAQSIVEQLEDAEKYLQKLFELQGNQSAKSRDEVRLKDGRTFDCYSAPIIDPASTRLGRVRLFRDITSEKRLQANVAQSDRLASMGMLAAGVAHEINNPLSYILYNLESLTEDLEGYASQSASLHQALAEEIGQERLAALLGGNPSAFDPNVLADMIERFKDALGGTRKIKDIARGLGSFSRVEKDRVVPVEIRGAIESAISIAFNEIKYRAQIVKDLRATARVMASEGRLSQVFLNLLVNAAHSIPDGNVDGNRICVKTWEEGNDVVVLIEDTGCGIPEEDLERIFDPFFTTKPIGIGSGLGLNIVRNIIAGYGGSVEVSSTVGKGTSFVIRLPMAAALSLRPDESPDTSRLKSGVRGRIMVVDDEGAVRGALKRILCRHEVVEADSGEQARDLLAEDQRFDLILCDMMMPRVSGIDLHKWLLEHYPALSRKIVFVTGGAFTPNARAYLEQVDNISIEKPFDSTNLLKMVTDWVSVVQAKERAE
jgi:PAS domain S-box-containing protein